MFLIKPARRSKKMKFVQNWKRFKTSRQNAAIAASQIRHDVARPVLCGQKVVIAVANPSPSPFVTAKRQVSNCS